MVLEWKNPPPADQGRHKWREVADELRTRPGEWAIVARDVSPATATSIKNGMIAAFRPAGTFEATTAHRNEAKNRCDVYARYVGDEAGS